MRCIKQITYTSILIEFILISHFLERFQNVRNITAVRALELPNCSGTILPKGLRSQIIKLIRQELHDVLHMVHVVFFRLRRLMHATK